MSIMVEKNKKFVFTLKQKYEEPKQTMSYDMLKYIATFIDASDEFTLISYVIVFPFTMYEIKKKILEYFKINTYEIECVPKCLYKFMNEPWRILIESLIPIFGTHKLIKYCIEYHKTILTKENGRRFVIHLIKEQNTASYKEINNILNGSKWKRKTIHPTFYTLDILYNPQIALLSRYIDFSNIDTYIYKKLKYYYINSNIRCLNTTEKALLMYYYDVYDNFNSKFIGKENQRYKLIIECLKSNYFKIIDILFENRMINNPNQIYSELNFYICNLKIGSEEFNKSSKILKYYLDRLIDFYNYEGAICNLLNYSFALNNIEMCKYLLSLNGARKGLSILLGSRCNNEPFLQNIRNSSKDEKDVYKEFILDVNCQSEFILYDLLINNLPNDVGIDLNVLANSIVIENVDYIMQSKYIFYIRKYIEYIMENENSENAINLDNPTDKYYCSRETLIKTYNILLFPKRFVELQIKLKTEFDELMKNDESSQISNQTIREYIKTLYCKIKMRQIHTKNIYILMENLKYNNISILEQEHHRNISILIEYLITIPEYLIDNKTFTNILITKINEFINATLESRHIETLHMIQNILKCNEMLKNMNLS